MGEAASSPGTDGKEAVVKDNGVRKGLPFSQGQLQLAALYLLQKVSAFLLNSKLHVLRGK